MVLKTMKLDRITEAEYKWIRDRIWGEALSHSTLGGSKEKAPVKDTNGGPGGWLGKLRLLSNLEKS